MYSIIFTDDDFDEIENILTIEEAKEIGEYYFIPCAIVNENRTYISIFLGDLGWSTIH